ncbi:hypothetical protein PtA15_9A177, partial [Puccinia triticina]
NGSQELGHYSRNRSQSPSRSNHPKSATGHCGTLPIEDQPRDYPSKCLKVPSRSKHHLTERQKKNIKVQHNINTKTFPLVPKDQTQPYVLRLNQEPLNTIRVHANAFESKKVVATDNMGSQILFLAQFHNLEDDNPVVNALRQVVKDLHLMGKN